MKKVTLLVLSFLILVSLSFPASSMALDTPTLLPISDGFYKEWSPKSGTTHFSMVDETICNGTTDFNVTDQVGERDSYALNIASIPNGATVTNISITPCAARKKTGSGTSILNLFYRLNGVNSANSVDYSLPTGNTPVVLGTTSFLLSTVKTPSSTLEIGALYNSGNKGVRLGQISAKLSYTPLFAPSNLMATASSSSAFLAWVDNSSNELGFNVERSTDSANFVKIASVSANATSYLNYPLPTGLYYYRVKSFNIGAESSPSGVASVFVN